MNILTICSTICPWTMQRIDVEIIQLRTQKVAENEMICVNNHWMSLDLANGIISFEFNVNQANAQRAQNKQSTRVCNTHCAYKRTALLSFLQRNIMNYNALYSQAKRKSTNNNSVHLTETNHNPNTFRLELKQLARNVPQCSIAKWRVFVKMFGVWKLGCFREGWRKNHLRNGAKQWKLMVHPQERVGIAAIAVVQLQSSKTIR